MKNRLLLSGLALCALTATAQQLHEGDIQWPNSQALYQYVQNWTPGQPVKVASATDANPSAYGVDFEDENFFISRVRLKPLFRNQNTQVNGSLNENNDKKLINWVPFNRADGGHPDALPNGLYDSEVFSSWSYVTHWGNWLAPQGWVPAALSDVAHKHGVLVSGVASIPYTTSISSHAAWKTSLDGLANFDSSTANKDKLAQFLYYHGVDGLGYNSEFGGYSSANMTKIQNVHKHLMNWMKAKGTRFENIWYDGTNDSGYIQFDSGLASHNDGNFSGASLFLNYNWNSRSLMNSSVNYATSMGKSSLDLYAGHNMQGGEPHSYRKDGNWAVLKDVNVSIGLWGSHNNNMIWALRAQNGSTPAAVQDTYQKLNEVWFTNCHRNPVKYVTPYNREKFQPDDSWFGMSAYMSARSSLSWDLSKEPFISFLNIGNGTFLNWKGVRQNDNEWYNLGVQDYMPTWRWWFTTSFLGKTANDVPATGLDAKFTWNDAWMGGSCLNIFGSTPKEYLHLFKTSYALATGDVITVRFKLMGGKANANLVLSLEGAETTAKEYNIFDTLQEVDDEWVEYSYTVTARDGLNNNKLAVIALGFEDAENLDLYLGEVSIVRTTTPRPVAPVITKTRILRNNYYGVDAKIIYKMPNTIEGNGEPCYNLDVNTSLFKLYAQVDGETKLMGITTSWAGLMFSIPAGDATSLKLGVQAVSTDFKSESDITWSENITLPAREISNEVVLSKNVIKPNEKFTVGYLDSKHAPAKWEIIDANSNKVIRTENSATEVVFDNGIAEVGPYNVKITEADGNVRQFNWMVQITSDAAGAMPEIYDVKLNDQAEEVTIEKGETFNVSYTGRDADGSATRALLAKEKWVGAKWGETGLSTLAGTPFSVAAWVKFTFADAKGTSAFFSIEDRSMDWPQSDWGWFYADILPDGTFNEFAFMTSYADGSHRIYYTFPDTRISFDVWTHVAFVVECDGNTKIRLRLYINGVLQQNTWECRNRNGNVTGRGGTEDFASYPNGVFNRESSMYFSFFGGRGEGFVTCDGAIDDLQLWNKAMTQQEVTTSMALNRNNLPAGVQCYWDFEKDDDYNPGTYTFKSIGANKTATASNFYMAEGKGRGIPTPQNAEYAAGNPFLTGEGYPVKTLPTWTGRRATVSNQTGNGAAGSATVSYSKAGEYTLTLKLANAYGEDTRDYPLITVKEPGGVNDVVADSDMTTYTIDDVLYVGFADNGDYAVSVYNLAGALVAQRAESVVAGQTMQITLGATGVYVVRVVKGDKEVKAFKVARK